MTATYVHFDKSTGKVLQAHRGRTLDYPREPGLGLGHHDRNDIHPNTHVVDVTALHELPDGDYWVEFVALLDVGPTVADLKARRAVALDRTDASANPPADRPDSARLCATWQPYRQALRDLGRFETPGEWIEHWPLRPDGGDDIADLRNSSANT